MGWLKKAGRWKLVPANGIDMVALPTPAPAAWAAGAVEVVAVFDLHQPGPEPGQASSGRSTSA